MSYDLVAIKFFTFVLSFFFFGELLKALVLITWSQNLSMLTPANSGGQEEGGYALSLSTIVLVFYLFQQKLKTIRVTNIILFVNAYLG